MRFEIICTGWNCAQYVDKCVRSVLTQNYQNFHLHLINDGSSDGTDRALSKFIGNPKVTVYNFTENMAAAYRRLQCIRPLDDESICLLLGMDDELLPNCLKRVSREYISEKWMTYGNWKDQRGNELPSDFNFEFSEKEHRERSYRKLKYRSTAPNTFKKFLFNLIPDTDFQLDGKWVDTTTESELMFSCLEMCGKERIGVIKDPIYMYNRGRVGGTLQRLGADYKMKVLARIMAREKKPLLINKPMTEKIVTVGLPALRAPIAWLAMESLCNQISDCKWELIVFEDANEPNGEKFYTDYLPRLENCERVIYIYSKGRVSLSSKWVTMRDYMHRNSIGLLLQAADCYSEPLRLQLTFDLLLKGFDWVHANKGIFYNIETGQTMMYKHRNGLTGLNMAISKAALSLIPKQDKYSGVDYWLYTMAQAHKRDFKSTFYESEEWLKGVDTDGRNRISLDRRKLYGNPVSPFEKTIVKIESILPAEIIKRMAEPEKQEVIENKIRVLNISSNDWANYSYYNYRSLKAVGVDVEGYKLHPHSFGYDEQHPVITRDEMIKKIKSGFDIVQVFNSDITMLQLLQGYKGKIVVYHTGSSYRASHAKLNPYFNPIVSNSVIALGEFAGLGANNETYISVAVDTDKLTVHQQSETIKKPYKFLHCPSNPKVKGTETIKKMFAKAHMSITVNTEIITHEESWKRMIACDIYVELFNPEINGDKYGSFGTTAAEAAALGKVVVTQNLSKEVYEKYYGDCPLILATDETDFIKKIKWLNGLPEKELLDLQKAHREWAVNKHSFKATGIKLKQALEI